MCNISLSYIYTYIDRERDSQPPTLECVIHGRALHTCACVSGGGAARGEATAGGGTAGGGMRTVPAPAPAVRCQGAVAPWAALAASMSRTCVCVCVRARARLCDESLCWHACTHVRMYAWTCRFCLQALYIRAYGQQAHHVRSPYICMCVQQARPGPLKP